MRLITKLWATLLLLCVAGVANAATEYEIDQKFTTLAELDGKLFAIADETAQTAMGIGVSGHNNGWDMYFGTYTETYTSNACYYKLEAAQGEGVEGYFYLRTYKNDGSMYTAWSDAEHYGYFNSQTGQGGYFALGLEGRNGQDAKNHAVWSIEMSEGKFALKNIGTGKYLHADQLSNTYDDAFYFTFCTLKEKPNTDPLADQKDALSDAIALGKMYNALAYTDATFGTLTTKIADGETALAAEGATAESLTAATTAINDAITALAFKEGFSSLKDVPFGKWNGWGADAQQTSTYNTTWELFKTTGQSYGDSGVNDYADLSAFDKLYVTVASGTPRILLNRDADNGQWNATEAESHLIDNTVGDADSWHQKYFAKEGNVYSVDLKQLTTDKGFAHLHSIKSRDNNVVTGLFLYKAPAAAVTTEVTFDFDSSEHAASSNNSHDGDITVDEVLTQDGVTMTITPSGTSTANRYWGTSPKMRMYGGTMTIVAPEGKAITKVVYNNGKWNAANTINGIVAEKGEWTGNSTNVVLSVSANTQIKSVVVTVADKNDETTTFAPVEPVHIANTAETAYTVAEAIALIDAGEALSETVFVKGIVSKVDEYNDQYKNITYWISADGTTEGAQFECFRGKGIDGAEFTSIDDIKVGATVIVKGTMKKFIKEGQDDIYEFNQNNELVSYVAPAPAPVVLEKVAKKAEMTGELKSIAELEANKFMLQNEAGLVIYTPDGWDVKVADIITATSNTGNGGLLEVKPLDGDHAGQYQIPIYNLDGTRRKYWAGEQYLNSQPVGGNVIFGLDGTAPKYGQDGQDLALWTIAYEAEKGFAFHCVGRDVYLGNDAEAARPVDAITYWKAYTGYNAGYDEAEILAAYELAVANVKATETATALTEAKTAYDTDKDLNKFGDAVNAAIDAIKACQALNEAYANLDETGAAIAAEVLAKYNNGEYANIAEMRAAYILAAKAQTTAGANMTLAIVNPSFEFGNINGWTSTNGGDVANNYNFAKRTGEKFVERWTAAPNKLSDGSLTQVITGLPAGKYKLTAEMQNLEQGNNDAAGQGYYLVANTDSMAVAVSGETVTVETELARKADLTIGAVMKGCTGNWVCVDNFQLTLVEPAPIPTLYAITIAETQNGTVTANDVEAAEGEVVTLTAKPAEGYIVDEAHVVYGENQEVELTINEAANTATFTMPASAVTVTITFKVDPIVTAKADLEAAITAAKAIETEGKNGADALATAITDAETALNAADATVETIATAKANLADAIILFDKANLDANLIEIAQEQQDQEGGVVTLATSEKNEKTGVITYTTKDQVSVIFKMKNVDVSNCDYILFKFAEPTPEGLSYAFWTNNKNKELPAGITEFKYVFAEDNESEIKDGIIPEISLLTIFTGAGKVVKVAGVYKHQVPVEVTHTWDFTKWSEATVANLKAEAAKVTVSADPDKEGNTKCEDNGALWSDHEKKPGTTCDTYAASKDNCFWYVGGEATPTANGIAIAEFAGLQFNTAYGASRALAIAVNYPSTSIGTYNGPSYLWFGGKGQTIMTIPAVKGGSTIKIGVESHKSSEARGIQLFAGETELKDAEGNAVAAPKTYTEQTWVVPAGVAYDIVVKNTNGCHIYFIDAEQDENTLTSINTVKSNVMNNAIYNLNGQKVNKAQKGLYIINGKKVIK
jgi:hypothetical protein